MKGLRSIPRILKIHEISGYQASLLFNNGESRMVDFKQLLSQVLGITPGTVGFELLESPQKFRQMEIIGTTVGWAGMGISSKDEQGMEVFYPFELDPVLLFQHSTLDPKRTIQIGPKIRHARMNAGLTQAELAHRSGTSKHYISKLENNKSDIELLTLKKIVEAGLGKYLQIEII
ncbi:helix-turn-helix transcriptional regulator [Pontibacter sp. G13]|uniref:helix-turn-helix domain-containing protein n=1 Tax=Pontibacter sp. G13 TaxID=3074898 RepID=UPI00288B1291|nr:helix-turn-helix transcriptional regulator [Pontibacter sp. G13]WNJ20700.1 helix-turn-helix transcriptional regulator [Pontibacter sp. G13]